MSGDFVDLYMLVDNRYVFIGCALESLFRKFILSDMKSSHQLGEHTILITSLWQSLTTIEPCINTPHVDLPSISNDV